MQKDLLHLAVVQIDIIWEDIATNLSKLDKMLEALKSDVDILVLPEMFSTGFTMNPQKVLLQDQEQSLRWIQLWAKRKDMVVIASVPSVYKGEYFNTLYFVQPDGSYYKYNKKHLFSLAKEHQSYSKGTSKLIIDYQGWRICPLICYDLRFPVFSRNFEDYDLLIYVANWPKTRILAWDTLLKARAIENMSYTVGVNRVGEDLGNVYSGHSQVVDTLGQYLLTPQTQEGIFYTAIDKKIQDTLREKLGFLRDRDQDLYSIQSNNTN
ncbi:MAG: nitrilase-related carbon-nitrogen hydrolase [Bacteroidota bacterium]|nr:nitrilase-related carbon-nitrogen hydrolase [Bacteroidota bacterium]